MEPVGQAAADELRDEREQTERKPREEPLMPPSALHPQRKCAPRGAVRSTGLRAGAGGTLPVPPDPLHWSASRTGGCAAPLVDERKHPLVAAAILEADEKDA